MVFADHFPLTLALSLRERGPVRRGLGVWTSTQLAHCHEPRNELPAPAIRKQRRTKRPSATPNQPLARWEEDWGEGKEAQPNSSATTYHRLRTDSTKGTPDTKTASNTGPTPRTFGERAGVRGRDPTRCLATTHTKGSGLKAPKQRQTTKTASNTGSTPSPFWGEGWGEGKEAQPSSSATTYQRLRTNSTKATPDHQTASNTGSTPSPLWGEGWGEGKRPPA